MRISIITLFTAFLINSSASQEWNIYSNIDSVGNIVKPYNYITEQEIKEKFNVFNFNIEKFSLENMSLLPMQLISNDQIKLERVPFYEDYLSFMSGLYFIGKIAVHGEKLNHYLFANVMDGIYTKYFLFNYYSGNLVSVLEICAKMSNIDFNNYSHIYD